MKLKQKALNFPLVLARLLCVAAVNGRERENFFLWAHNAIQQQMMSVDGELAAAEITWKIKILIFSAENDVLTTECSWIRHRVRFKAKSNVATFIIFRLEEVCLSARKMRIEKRAVKKIVKALSGGIFVFFNKLMAIAVHF